MNGRFGTQKQSEIGARYTLKVAKEGFSNKTS